MSDDGCSFNIMIYCIFSFPWCNIVDNFLLRNVFNKPIESFKVELSALVEHRLQKKAQRLYQSIKLRSPPRATLVLDLDETLIHSSMDSNSTGYDYTLTIREGVDRFTTLYVYFRPYVLQFLADVSRWYEVVIFTAGRKNYANPVIDALDTAGVVSRRYFRPCCDKVQGQVIIQTRHYHMIGMYFTTKHCIRVP